MNSQKYLIQCKYCGTILFKAENPAISVFAVEIKCPNSYCKKILKLPRDIQITLDKTKKKI